MHLLDREADLYGERLCCAFIERLRGEETFETAGALIEQMGCDSARAREALARLSA